MIVKGQRFDLIFKNIIQYIRPVMKGGAQTLIKKPSFLYKPTIKSSSPIAWTPLSLYSHLFCVRVNIKPPDIIIISQYTATTILSVSLAKKINNNFITRSIILFSFSLYALINYHHHPKFPSFKNLLSSSPKKKKTHFSLSFSSSFNLSISQYHLKNFDL